MVAVHVESQVAHRARRHGAEPDVVAVQAGIDRPDGHRGRRCVDPGDRLAEGVGEPHATLLDADQRHTVGAVVALDDLVRHPGDRASHVVGPQDLLGALRRAGFGASSHVHPFRAGLSGPASRSEGKVPGTTVTAMHDLVISGGLLVDGTGAPARIADVAVSDGVITEVADAGRSAVDRRRPPSTPTGCSSRPGGSTSTRTTTARRRGTRTSRRRRGTASPRW